MKTYQIEPLNKKSFITTTTYLNDEGNEVVIHECWRSGLVTAELTEADVEVLRNQRDTQFFELFNSQVEECHDLCSNDVQSDCEYNSDTFEDEYQFDDCFATVCGPCEVTLYED